MGVRCATAGKEAENSKMVAKNKNVVRMNASLKIEALSRRFQELASFYAGLAEIDENMIRCNLTPAQEASAIARRKAIYEQLHPETKRGGNSGPNGQFVRTAEETFTSATADATGRTDRDVRRAASRGEALGGDLADIAGLN